MLSCEAKGEKPIGILWNMNNKRLDSLVDPRYGGCKSRLRRGCVPPPKSSAHRSPRCGREGSAGGYGVASRPGLTHAVQPRHHPRCTAAAAHAGSTTPSSCACPPSTAPPQRGGETDNIDPLHAATAREVRSRPWQQALPLPPHAKPAPRHAWRLWAPAPPVI